MVVVEVVVLLLLLLVVVVVVVCDVPLLNEFWHNGDKDSMFLLLSSRAVAEMNFS